MLLFYCSTNHGDLLWARTNKHTSFAFQYRTSVNQDSSGLLIEHSEQIWWAQVGKFISLKSPHVWGIGQQPTLPEVLLACDENKNECFPWWDDSMLRLLGHFQPVPENSEVKPQTLLSEFIQNAFWCFFVTLLLLFCIVSLPYLNRL